ncbi:MAG: STAS domain-containing protein [Elusimicrobiota bacterium]
MGLNISVNEREPGVYLIIPKGEINTETYSILEERLKEAILKANALVIEMGQVSYISSMGLSAIFRIKLAIEERKGTIALVNMQPQVKQVFETMKILTPQMFASLQEADEYMDKFLDGVQKGTIKPQKPLE